MTARKSLSHNYIFNIYVCSDYNREDGKMEENSEKHIVSAGRRPLTYGLTSSLRSLQLICTYSLSNSNNTMSLLLPT